VSEGSCKHRCLPQLAPGTIATRSVHADIIQVRGPVDQIALSRTIAGRDIVATGKDILQPVQIKALNPALTPGEMRSDNFPVRDNGKHAVPVARIHIKESVG
jgi:hypothetical protein